MSVWSRSAVVSGFVLGLLATEELRGLPAAFAANPGGRDFLMAGGFPLVEKENRKLLASSTAADAMTGTRSVQQGMSSQPPATVGDVQVQSVPDPAAPQVSVARDRKPRAVRDSSTRRGILLRSNVGLTAARVAGVSLTDPEYSELSRWRFATVNHLSIGYGWRSNLALTIDGFRMVVPHRPHADERARFDMRVDAEVLGLAVGTTTFYPPLSLHLGQALGYVMGRIGGGLLNAPNYKGVGNILFVGFELMRSERIGIVLAAQCLQLLAVSDHRQLTARSYGLSLGVTYW